MTADRRKSVNHSLLVVCVVDTLLIHCSTDKTRKKKVNNLFRHTISVNDKQVTLWVSYSPKAYMNQDIMEKWISDIYREHLTVSLCQVMSYRKLCCSRTTWEHTTQRVSRMLAGDISCPLVSFLPTALPSSNPWITPSTLY